MKRGSSTSSCGCSAGEQPAPSTQGPLLCCSKPTLPPWSVPSGNLISLCKHMDAKQEPLPPLKLAACRLQPHGAHLSGRRSPAPAWSAGPSALQ